MNEKKEVKSPDAEAPQALADETLEGISGGSAVPEQWPAFQAILELCGALAENRSKRETAHTELR